MSSDVIDLFSGICVIIDESLNEETAVPNNIQKIENSLKENLIPIIKLSELPEDAFLQHLHSVSFIILDWNLTGLNPIPEVAIADNIDFIKKLRNYCYVPIFIFSDENVHAIIVKLEEETNGISIYEIKIKYELSSLSAPLGQNYSGTSLTGTFYIAYNPESEMWCKFAGKSASEVKRFIDNDKNWIK